MKQKLFGFIRSDRRGLALISVLGVVTLATILILSLYSVSDAEFKSSVIYSDAATSKHLADTATRIVIGQIQAAATGAGTPGSPNGEAAIGTTIWASQPGAVRVYDAAGNFILGRTLYSSSKMVWGGGGAGGGLDGEKKMTQKVPAATWAQSLDQWVDLNRPVMRAKGGAAADVYFPIFDPRATAPRPGFTTAVEGFSILSKTTGATDSVSSNDLGVKLTGGQETWRLPMPVEWLYVLKDGSVGTVAQPAGGVGNWVSVGNLQPTEINPIIGRVGFWTDDECCKININTAGEPGYWNSPTALHDRERHWADSPPAIFEYQRYPGHPATVALSSVFAPGFNPNTYFPSGYPPANLTFKNSIYDFVPQLAAGGTNDGQLPFYPNDMLLGASQQATPQLNVLVNNIAASKTEPLFPSVDDAMFDSRVSGGNSRTARRLIGPSGQQLLNPQVLEQDRAFLTAHSRAPETNMFGLPRVAIWPVPDTSTPGGSGSYKDYRTGFDSAVAICAKLGSTTSTPLLETANSYYFRRLNSSSHLTDMGRDSKGSGSTSGLGRNNSLMNYLNNLVKMTMPGGSSFNQKYSNGDAQQILVEIFDYIRCTNLYDSYLSSNTAGGHTDDERRDESLGTASKLKTPVTVLWDQAPNKNQYFTYTPPRFTVKRVGSDEGLNGAPTNAQAQYNQDPEWVKTGTYPGHGQVKPIEWTDSSGRIFRGFGRFPTISEVGLHFICTGDGLPDAGSYNVQGVLSGGKTAEHIDPLDANHRTLLTLKLGSKKQIKRYWYSNLPPYPNVNVFETMWGCKMSDVNKETDYDPTLHPGWEAANWNFTLEFNPSSRSGVPLLPDEKRIQVCLLIETFVPSVGYTRYTPDFTMVLKPEQVSGIKVKDSHGQWQSVFSTTDPHMVVQSTYAFAGDERGLNASHAVSPLGGHFAPDAITTGRQVASIGKMPKDPSYQQNATGNIHSAMLNFPLVSNFLTVKRQDGSGRAGTLEFKVEKPLEIDIYATHDWQGTLDPANGVASQIVNVKFPTGTLTAPVPHLVVYSTERRDYVDSSGNHYLRKALPAPHWWCFNYAGALNRYSGTPDPVQARAGTIDWGRVTENPGNANDPDALSIYGRFHPTPNTGSATTQDTFNPGVAKNTTPGFQGVNVPISGLIYGWSTISNYNGVLANPDKDFGNVDTYRPQGDLAAVGAYGYYGSDSVRSIIPRHGDYRMLAARKVVDANVWVKHPVWDKRPQSLFAHSLSGSYSDSSVGFDMGGDTDSTSNPKYRLVPNVYYEPNSGTDGDGKTGRLPVVPDTPLTAAASAASTRYRDWDNGPGNLRDGPYINKPDDGNLSVMKFWHGHGTNDKSGVQQGFYVIRNTYFSSSFLQLPATQAFFTPNRMMSSPGMFGSLPTGVWGSLASKAAPESIQYAGTDGVPWRTLLFRADVDGHVGAPAWTPQKNGGGGVSPADHYFMDLFFMPVVEPYAITDSYSTAGKINLNYQIVPFTNIRRATAIYAAMKGEMITAYSSADTDPRKGSGLKASDTNTVAYKKIKDVNPIPPDLWLDGDVYWHRELDVDATVAQLDERFAFQGNPAAVGSVGLMLAPSQICELHLIPKIPSGTQRPAKGDLPAEPSMTGLNYFNRTSTMANYWKHNDLTGDNTRERPYANLYQKFTTRSNVFQVYFTAQTLRKARSLRPGQVDSRRDTVTSEFRGSALIERYLDFSQAGATALAANDYGDGNGLNSKVPLEHFYHYRILETKQFSP